MSRKGGDHLSDKLALRRDEPMEMTSAAGRQRIDRWLWHARLVRTRSAAAALAAAGFVRVNGTRIDAPGRMVRLGDVITVALDHAVRVLKVRGFTERRGPPSGGQELYEELA
jgi:ribosome-associated heat shock protein Hsp15